MRDTLRRHFSRYAFRQDHADQRGAGSQLARHARRFRRIADGKPRGAASGKLAHSDVLVGPKQAKHRGLQPGVEASAHRPGQGAGQTAATRPEHWRMRRSAKCRNFG